MLVVGVTGGIGSGKSTVSEMLAHLGARVIDADVIAREVVVEDPRVLLSLVQTFGEDIRQGDGSLDRRLLGRRAFYDQESRKRLDGILHPPILARIREMLERIGHSGYEGIVVVDAALLVECDALNMVDRLVVVEAPESLRRQRMKVSKGLTDEEFQGRAAAQLADGEKSKLAHHVIVNDGTIDGLREQVRGIWRRLTEEAAQEEASSR